MQQDHVGSISRPSWQLNPDESQLESSQNCGQQHQATILGSCQKSVSLLYQSHPEKTNTTSYGNATTSHKFCNCWCCCNCWQCWPDCCSLFNPSHAKQLLVKMSDIASNRKQKPSDVFVKVPQNMLSGCLQTKRIIFWKMWLLFYYFWQWWFLKVRGKGDWLKVSAFSEWQCAHRHKDIRVVEQAAQQSTKFKT